MTNPANQPTRPTRWQPIAPTSVFPFHLLKLLTLFGLVGIPAGLVGSGQLLLSVLVDMKNKLLPFWWHSPMAIDPPWQLFLILTGLAIGTSPWLIQFFLASRYSITKLSTSALSQYSPEAYRILQRIAKESKIPLPSLSLIDCEFPIALSYGFAPKIATIAVSKSLLTSLDESEIAALYAQEMAHIATWTLPLMSGSIVLQALPYLVYLGCARLGDGLLLRSQRPMKFAILGGIWVWIAKLCGILASGFYGIYQGLRWTGLWLSRSRTAQSDRIVCNATGNPNGMAMLLLKLTQAVRQSIVNHQSLPMELELLEPLLPIALYESICTRKVQSIANSQADRWLEINQSQVPLSVRLSRLATIARSWQVNPIFDYPEQPWSWKPNATMNTWAKPWVWAIVGYATAWATWGLGWITYWAGFSRLAWLGSDYDLFLGLPLLGFGLGTFLRFNGFFPDLPTSLLRVDESQSQPEVSSLSNNIENGLSPQQVMISGRLMGRSGFANWVAQDLWLVTARGNWIPLHLMGKTGAIGLVLARLLNQGLLNQGAIADPVGKSVVVSGWFRKGVMSWIDVEAVRLGSRVVRGEHQVASVIVGAISVVMGLYIAL